MNIIDNVAFTMYIIYIAEFLVGLIFLNLLLQIYRLRRGSSESSVLDTNEIQIRLLITFFPIFSIIRKFLFKFFVSCFEMVMFFCSMLFLVFMTDLPFLRSTYVVFVTYY